jgi:hypothetical protein
MVIALKLPIKPYSINRYYYSDRQTKTAAARNWELQTLGFIKEHAAAFKTMYGLFDESKHAFRVKLDAYYPSKEFMNKAGRVSARTMDLSNWEKPLLDLLFLPKYVGNLGIDDRFIVELKSTKQESPSKTTHYVTVEIVMFELTSTNQI